MLRTIDQGAGTRNEVLANLKRRTNIITLT
jgi:hypothetical protein